MPALPDVAEAWCEVLPAPLREDVARSLSALLEQPALAARLANDPDLRALLLRVIATSPYAAEVMVRYPDLLEELMAGERLARPEPPGGLRTALSSLAGTELAEAALLRQLRRFRHRELLRIIWRDLAGSADVTESLRDLSLLADACICVALDWAECQLRARHGHPRNAQGQPVGLGVLAMGKLGGHELNFSSDVDLVFVYSDAGESDGERPVANEEYFRRLAQRLIDLLSRQTADGFVYRVDARLRPFGSSGPLAVSLPALETYLVRHGRDWERYAYVKARVVNDWADAASLHADVLRPFIYRRYLDYGVFSSLRAMKALIEAEVQRGEFRDNIKLGAGGIREIEFIAQSIQLVRGGTLPDLRQPGLLAVLQRLVAHGCLPAVDAAELQESYRFLRLLENRIQAMHDRQTHDLPDDGLGRSRLVLAMQAADWAALEREVARQRERVSRHFRAIVFRTANGEAAVSTDGRLSLVWTGALAGEDADEALEGAGYQDPAAARERLGRLRDSALYARMDEHGRQRLDALMPAILAAAARQPAPLPALDGVLRVIEAIGRRSAYFALLSENPAALERLTGLCAMSDFLVRQVAQHPMLLDELLDPRVFQAAPDRDELAADLAARLAAAGEDIEQQLNALRFFQRAATFRIAVTDLSGMLPLMKVSDRLTDIAELVLSAALELAWRELAQRHGEPGCRMAGQRRRSEFAIVAFGKLGGLELGYGSDLDLVFLHDSEGEEQQTDGAQPLENSVFFGRLARRVISILTMPTPSGRLYEVDIRLRPSGRSGLLVSSLVAFERYEYEDAWTWEHQALLRSRAVAGSAAVCAAFEALRTRVLTGHVRLDTLREDVASMRQKMRDELAGAPAGQFDIKQDPGGITDIEFIVQYLVLANAHGHPGLVRWSDNIRQLEALAAHGLIEAGLAQRLAEAYRAWRSRLHRLSLAGVPGRVDAGEMVAERAEVTALWQSLFPAAGAAPLL
jgi:glutamate-ammonia-ligase adenylyltransferase